MATGELELTTETVTVGHPEAAEVELVGPAPGVSLLTKGTLLFRLSPRAMSLGLKIDGTFVTAQTRLADAIGVTRALAKVLPPGFRLATTLDGMTLMVNVLKEHSEPEVLRVEPTCTDRSLRARQSAANRLVFSGLARGASRLSLNVGSLEVSIALGHKETPLQVALRLRQVLETRFTVLLTVPTRRDGDVTVTLLHRR